MSAITPDAPHPGIPHAGARAEPGDTDDVVGRARAHLAEPGRSHLRRLVATSAGAAPALARLTLGIVMLPHALQKTFGWCGGAGFGAAYEGFQQMGIPGPLAFLAIWAELLGAVGLILGAFTRAAAAAIIAVMLGAIAIVHLPHGFFMNWSGKQAGEGYEYHLLAIALGLVCLLEGGGRASIDRLLMRWRPANGGSVSRPCSEG
jgi:putative oxidoreductase